MSGISSQTGETFIPAASTNGPALERIMIALERTLPACATTIPGMIAAGAAMDKRREAQHKTPQPGGVARRQSGHFADLKLVGSGLLLLIITTLHYRTRNGQPCRMMTRPSSVVDAGLLPSLLLYKGSRPGRQLPMHFIK